MQIRIATLEDLEGIHQVESVSFNDPWSKQSFSDELNNPMTTYLVAEQDKDILGFVGMWEVVGEGQITNVAVHTKARKRGIGKALIEALVDYSKSRKLEVLLVVNIARQLVKTYKHSELGIATGFISVIALIGGQLIVERILNYGMTIGVIINFIGGIYFIYLVMKERAK